jgi:HD superfamily phosphohydrolase
VFPGSKDRVFRDPVHGLIEFRGARRPLADLLDTRALQRLRLIRQMGWAPMVYPGAEHSRFGHALGAYHVATRVVDQLRLEPEVGRHVLVAAMLHDIGHGPFSHAWEHVFGGSDHEAWGGRIVAEDDELASALEALEPGLGATLARFWGKTYRPHFARKLVSSQLDVDRLDYLLRDGHYSGAGYATYDLDWIIHALQIERVRDGDDDPADLVVDYRRGMYAVEQYLFARSYMYAQVYHHKTVRAAEWLFIKTMERFAALARTGDEPPGLEIAARMARGGPVSVTDFLALHDAKLVAALERWAGSTGRRPRTRSCATWRPAWSGAACSRPSSWATTRGWPSGWPRRRWTSPSVTSARPVATTSRSIPRSRAAPAVATSCTWSITRAMAPSPSAGCCRTCPSATRWRRCA